MAVRNLQNLEDALDGAVFARPTMQDVENNVGLRGGEHGRDVTPDVDARDPKSLPFQGVGAGFSRAKADLAFSRPASHQNGNVFQAQSPCQARIVRPFSALYSARLNLSFQAGTESSAARPMRLISHSSKTPE